VSTPPAIVVERLCKRYRVYDTPLDALKEALTHRPRHRDFLALDDVSFTVARGERVGIVGANGAGKSTLLRILSGTLDHTAGRFAIEGRLRAVLELGTGFHEECTGRENVLMGGLCMGYARSELEERLDWIIEFSGLARVIDQPLRTYSSGMKSRLMYAVAFCRSVEVMIVDEALATGDGAFVRKCTQHIVDLCSHGATALVVSHNLYFLERLCDRVLYLRHGQLVADGEPLAVCKQYEADLGRDFVAAAGADLATGAGLANGATDAAGASAAADGGVPFLRAEAPVPAPEPAAGADPRNGLHAGLVVAEAPAAWPDWSAWPVPEPLPPGPAGEARSNGAGEIRGADGRWEPFDFSGAPAVRALGLVRLREAMLLDEQGRRTSQIVVGRPARLRFVLESRVRKRDANVGFMVWSDRDVHVATTTTACSLDEAGRPNGVRVDLAEGVFAIEVAFPSLRLGAGRYWLRFGVGPGREHYSEDDLLLSESRCLAFAVLRPDHVQDVFHEPVSRWSGLLRLSDLPASPAAPTPPVPHAARPPAGRADEAAHGVAR
jgi:ABC-type polysaccharide/polyol phosphate transport system ATPase subunit